MDETPNKRHLPLDYAPRPERRGIRFFAARFFARLSQPMPVGMYYVITFVLSIVAMILAVIIRFIVLAFS